MTLFIPNTEAYDNIILFDIEYDQLSLVQYAGLLLTKVGNNLYKLTKSINFYVKQSKPLNPFFIKYTNITDEFLNEKGISWLEALHLLYKFYEGCDTSTLLISHGVKNDLHILAENGIPLPHNAAHYCTHNSAKRILQRESGVSLADLTLESGYQLFNAHNAYADVWGTLHVFCYLKELENENT